MIDIVRIAVHAGDEREPIPLTASLREVEAGGHRFAVPVYTADRDARYGTAPPVLCFAGGGSSGVVFAKLIRRAAERGVKVVAFDVPGHTPAGLLGARTPPASDLRFASPRVRRRIAARLFDDPTVLAPGERVQVLGHSAGVLDVADLDPARRRRVARFALLGTGVPSFASMRGALRAAQAQGLASDGDWRSILRTRALPTGHPDFHFGAREHRAAGDELLARYQGDEHWAVVARLFLPGQLSARHWSGARVELVASAGDPIAPPRVMQRLADWLVARGADARLHVLDQPLPHMFMMFEEGAERVAELLATAA